LKTFQELDLIDPLRKALADEAYETPTPIQAQTIPAALQGRDVLGCAQTGTGKTAAFALPILNRLGNDKRRATANRPQALILAPTRELAIQIGESFATYGKHLKLRYALVYGGVSQVNQVRSLDRGAHVLVATPGRLLDLMGQGSIDLRELEVFVLDEADRMLDMGFLPDLKKIIAALPKNRQSLFFSATMPPNIIELSQQLLTDPVSVNVTPKSTSVRGIHQQVLFVDRSEKHEILKQLLSLDEVERAIVFTRTKRGANVVADKLLKSGITAVAIHGNKSQNARQRALELFRRKEVRVLVATDVAARGIDIDGITHVINYDMPVEAESYVHRIGRTGRAGAEGIALSFCTSDEYEELLAIEKLIAMPLAAANERPPALTGAVGRPQGGGGLVRGNRGKKGNGGPAKISTAQATPSASTDGRRRQRRSGPAASRGGRTAGRRTRQPN
jgi:ATP-dependent RNA helicase RhlE